MDGDATTNNFTFKSFQHHDFCAKQGFPCMKQTFGPSQPRGHYQLFFKGRETPADRVLSGVKALLKACGAVADPF